MSKTFAATLRTRAGKGAARATRRAGLVPAVIYGGNKEPVLISLPIKDTTTKIMAGKFLSTVFTVEVGSEKIRVLPRDFTLDKLDDSPVHVDFLRVTDGSLIRVAVPVHFVGQDVSPGIKLGGVLNIVAHSVFVRCPPDLIPVSIDVDVSGLGIGDTVHRGDLQMPEGVVTVEKDNFTVASIAPPQVDRSATAATPAAAA
jgi:large subunit ribosomal protein L25